jgi:TRAP-type C4-dicarboxylate transport system substrate-binding protein
VEKATEGRVKITIYPGGALGRPPEQYDAAATGIVDIAYGLHCYTPGKFPLTSVLELPFLVNSGKAGSRVLWDLYEKFPQIRAEHPGVKVLWLWTHDAGQLVTNKPIRTMSDLKGMKLRCPSASQKAVIQAWGASPVMMPVSQLYESLQKGVVDGTVICSSGIYDFNLQKVTQYLTLGDFYVSTFFMVMNENAWRKLSPKDQKIINGLIGKSMSDKAGAIYDRGGELGLEVCKKAGMQIYTLPEAERAKWKDAVMPLHEKWVSDMESKGLPGKEVYQEALRLAKKYNH